MSESIDLQPIKDILSQNGRILILFGRQATVDHVGSALALYLTLQGQGKDVTIASPAEMRAEFSRLIGLDQITQSISNRDLVIGFENYNFDSIEKVSHNEGSNNRFELIIQPKAGQKSPDAKDVKFSYRGADADLVITVGISRLEDLGSIYESESSLFSKATVVSFNRRQTPNFAAMSLVDNNASSLAEMVTDFLNKLQLPPTNDTASNLLAGIDFATNRFQNPMISPAAFILAGKLLQNGAKRLPPRMNGMGSDNGFMPFVPPSSVNPAPFGKPKPQSSNQSATKAQSTNDQQQITNNQSNPPQDWLKPKIYKGGSSLK